MNITNDKLDTFLLYTFYPYTRKKYMIHSTRYKEECEYILKCANDNKFYEFLKGWNFEIDENFILTSYQLVENANTYNSIELRKLVVDRLNESIVKQAEEINFLDYVSLDYNIVKNVGVKISLTPISLTPYLYFLNIIKKSKWISPIILIILILIIIII